MTEKQRLHRAEFLINWFLEVFNGRYAPYPHRCFAGIANQMRVLLSIGGSYTEKYGGRGPGARQTVNIRRKP